MQRVSFGNKNPTRYKIQGIFTRVCSLLFGYKRMRIINNVTFTWQSAAHHIEKKSFENSKMKLKALEDFPICFLLTVELISTRKEFSYSSQSFTISIILTERENSQFSVKHKINAERNTKKLNLFSINWLF